MSIDHDKLLALCAKARELQSTHYGDACGLHLDMIDWAKEYDSALAQPAEAVEGETDIIRNDVHRVLAEGDGYWQACSGCHETNQGYETGLFPYSETFKCHLGSGCTECGGLGAIWFEIPTVAELEQPADAAQGAVARVARRSDPDQGTYLVAEWLGPLPEPGELLFTHPQATPAQGDDAFLRRGLWECFKLAGGDTDGASGPEAIDNADLTIIAVRTVRDLRECYDELAAAPSPEPGS